MCGYMTGVTECRGFRMEPRLSTYHTLYDIPPIRFIFPSIKEGSKKLPDDGRLLPKHVGASI
jgi:hypothetical protein